MKNSVGSPRLATIPKPMEDEKMRAIFGVRDQSNFERHVQDRQGEHADRWRRMVRLLMTLAPLPGKFLGAHMMQFYIPDGKYRKQVFLLQGLDDGTLVICLPDVLRHAIQRGILIESDRSESEGNYRPFDSTKPFQITKLDGKMNNLDASFKDMVGWNRKAIKVELSAHASPEHLSSAEQLCALAAEQWQPVLSSK